MPSEDAEPLVHRRLVVAYALLGIALAVGAVAAVAGLWLLVGGVAPGSSLRGDLRTVVAVAGVGAGALTMAWAVYVSARALWPRLPSWVRSAVGALLLAVVMLSFLID